MSFQPLVDIAESISINRKQKVATTTARDGTVRAVSRGAQPWRFEVRLPDGPRWTDLRQIITAAEVLDRTTATSIQFNDPGVAWFIGYQGDMAAPSTTTATWFTTQNYITLTSGTVGAGEYKFKPGDFIQVGNHCYTVTNFVAQNDTRVYLHRPLLESGNGTIAVGADCVFNVQCTTFPEWTLFARDQVSWTDTFVFVESMEGI